MNNTLLIIGAGSIGSRHARNAVALGYAVAVLDPDAARAQKLADEVQATHIYASLDEALAGGGFDAAVIASPSSAHVADARALLQQHIPIFIEKPLATSLEGIQELVALAQEQNVVTMMGQSYRFHETFLALKKYLDEGRIGRVYHAQFFGGQYLPDWHPGMDYRTEYAAQRAQGGGVMFTSKSHTLDFAEWLFGRVQEYAGWKDRLGSLELDVDDSAFLLMKTDRNVVVYAQYDFLERPRRSRVMIAGEQGTMDADFVTNTILINNPDGTTETITLTPDPNAHYVEELRYFMELVKNGAADPALDIAHGAHIVELMLDPRVRDLTTHADA